MVSPATVPAIELPAVPALNRRDSALLRIARPRSRRHYSGVDG